MARRTLLCLVVTGLAASSAGASSPTVVIEVTVADRAQLIHLDEVEGVPATLAVAPGETVLQIATTGWWGAADVAVRSPGRSGSGECVENWVNSGGNPGRNGQSDEIGPVTAAELWSGGRPSLIAWQPVIELGRAYMVRMTDFGTSGDPEASPVVAMDLETGTELWAEHLPFVTDDWTSWIAGVNGGRVYASRAGNGATVSAKVYGLDAQTGAVVWQSEDDITSGAYDGVVFAPDGDLVVGNFQSLMRIDAGDGSTVWSSPRQCSVTSSCGAAVHGGSVYVVDATAGGHVVKRFGLASGAELYESTLMPGFTAQNTPMVGPDGTVYFSRTQNNPTVDFFYAFTDTGAALVERWHVPAAWTTASEFGVTAGDAPLMVAPGGELHLLDPETGTMTATSGPLPGLAGSHLAIDGAGTVYLSNRGFNDGRLWALDPSLAPLWDVPVRNINIGGPAIGRAGAVLVCGIGTDVRAYRAADATSLCHVFSDGLESGDTTRWSSTTP
jgi:outer membrane protein assembly factor BamB